MEKNIQDTILQGLHANPNITLGDANKVIKYFEELEEKIRTLEKRLHEHTYPLGKHH